MSGLGSAFRSFWHTMTSYDRHSSYGSPHRTGRNVPLSAQNGLTSVVTASDSRADFNSFRDDSGRHSSSTFDASHGGPMSPGPNRPYSPGMRSLSARQSSMHDGFEIQSPTGEIPMQSFQDGVPPPPSVASSWSRIDNWAEENYPELYDQLCEGCTVNDLNELEYQLDCSLPQDVRDSLQIHDGQERGGNPTGIIFGSMLLDCEEIVQEWENWRKVNQEFLLEATFPGPAVPQARRREQPGIFVGSCLVQLGADIAPEGNWRQDLLARQDCVPPNSIQKAYAHPGWIPLVRDWGGNNLAVDLAPGPKGHWGQVILFGRDYDTKYVVARSWAAFLAIVADDLNSGRWFIDEDSGELKLREFKTTRVEPAYFDILRWRMDQKHGRTASKRKSLAPSVASLSAPTSPYAGPTDPSGEHRGRSMQRLTPISPIPSPIRPGYGKSSPLARVAEESTVTSPSTGKPGDKLVEVDTPRPSGEENRDSAPRLTALANGDAAAAEETKPETQANGSATANKQPTVEVEPMKTIEI